MKKNLKLKILAGALALASVIGFAGCSQGGNDSGDNSDKGSFDTSRKITVVSREDGSGTRGAFIELLGIEEKNGDTKTDRTTKDALIANKTGVVITNIQTDDYAIGYISMGSLSKDVKAVSIDGVKASAKTVKDGSYVLSRPFVIAVREDQNDLSKDFINFILSAEGQKVVSESYVTINDNAAPFEGTNPKGRIVVAGSSSVTPVMEKLAEAYKAVNHNGEIEIQQSDSTAGMMAVSSGTADIGMASRDLKDSEKETLTGINIALDAIAVIVNPNNPVDSLTSEQVHSIYVGDTTTWDAVTEG